MPKVSSRSNAPESITAHTQMNNKPQDAFVAQWWKAASKKEKGEQLIGVAAFLKTQQQYRYRQASIYTRLYGNQPLFNVVGTSIQKMNLSNMLPIDRPTMNVVQSCIDTLVSRLTQSRPRPVFLTDGADYKERNTAKLLNNFIQGEFYQTDAYELGAEVMRDASALGTGVVKIIEKDNKVCLERVLLTELLVDISESFYNPPRQMYQFRLVDRSVLLDFFPEDKSVVRDAEQAYPDNSAEASKSVADTVMVVEGWHLPSGPHSKDGRHVIACSSGLLLDEEWTREEFPFVFLNYSPRIAGFWGQGLAEQLMGTQVEINKLLMTISKSINLVGVPRVFVEDGSKVVKSHINNEIGAIVTYRGTKPQYEVAPCVPQELYAQLERLVQFAYQQAGVSTMAAAAQKPAGLDSGEAIRNYDDLQSDRFAALARRYTNFYIDLAYQIIAKASEIAEREGKYETVYPGKNGTKTIDLPHMDLLQDPFVIQCFDSSSLPRDPAGRLAKVTEMMQAGLIDPAEGRRLLDYPDIEQVDKLANAAEERILQILDEIVDKGKYTPPDPFMDIAMATKLVTQYYNLYVPAKLEEKRAQLLRDFFTQLQALQQAAMPPAPPAAAVPQANPMPAPTNPMIPNVPGAQK